MFFIFIVIASRVYKWFLLLFLYMIFVLLIRDLTVSLLCFVIRYCFMVLMSKRWDVRQRESGCRY